MRPWNNLKNTIPSDTCWRFQLIICMKVKVHSSLKPPLKYNQEQTRRLWWTKIGYDIFNQFGSKIKKNTVSDLILKGLEGKAGKEIHDLSSNSFLKEFLANNFALSDTDGNTWGPLNRGDIADFFWPPQNYYTLTLLSPTNTISMW